MKSTDFVQASALARASEGQLSHNDRVSKAADCASVDALCAFVRSLFPQDAMPQDGLTLDALCDAYLSAAVKLVRSFSPVPKSQALHKGADHRRAASGAVPVRNGRRGRGIQCRRKEFV